MRVALVTGGARGIGRAIAHDLASDHATAITYHTTDPGPLVTERPDVFAIKADLASPDAAMGVIQSVVEHFGQIDVIVNNAGVVLPTPPEATEFAAHRQNIEVNLIAPVALLAAALPHLKPGASEYFVRQRGSADHGRVDLFRQQGCSEHMDPQHGKRAWTARHPRQCHRPGAIERVENPRSDDLIELFVKDTALGRIGTPEDIASAVRFLATGASGFITGEILTVSGGYRL